MMNIHVNAEAISKYMTILQLPYMIGQFDDN